MPIALEGLAHLGAYEKLQLVEDLWDSLEQAALPPVSDDTYAELTRRAAWADANPGHDSSLEQIAARLGVYL